MATSIEQKIAQYSMGIKRWQFDPAMKLANKFDSSGIAVLLIVTSYIESVAKFRDGYCDEYESKKFFKKAFSWCFPRVSKPLSPSEWDSLTDTFYKKVRCGLYHVGKPDMDIVGLISMQDSEDYVPKQDIVILTGKPELHAPNEVKHTPIQVYRDKDGVITSLIINPDKIILPLTTHLDSYLKELMNPANQELRYLFERRYDWLSLY